MTREEFWSCKAFSRRYGECVDVVRELQERLAWAERERDEARRELAATQRLLIAAERDGVTARRRATDALLRVYADGRA